MQGPVWVPLPRVTDCPFSSHILPRPSLLTAEGERQQFVHLALGSDL